MVLTEDGGDHILDGLFVLKGLGPLVELLVLLSVGEGLVVVLHVSIVAYGGAIVQRKVGKISGPRQVVEDDDPEDEPAGGGSHGGEDEVVVLAFHAPIVAHSPENARVFPKKLIVLSAWYIRT